MLISMVQAMVSLQKGYAPSDTMFHCFRPTILKVSRKGLLFVTDDDFFLLSLVDIFD